MDAAVNSEANILEGTKKLLEYFKENESELALKDLVKKQFFPNKKDLNFVLYTLLGQEIVKQTQATPPKWQRKSDFQLTDEFKKDILEKVSSKLPRRKSGNYLQIIANNVQIGNNNIIKAGD